MARLGLRPDEELGRPGDVRARGAVRPGRRVQPVADRGAQQHVPGRVELHLVDPVAPRVVGAQHRRMLVGQPGVLLGLPGPGQLAQLVQLSLGPAGAFPAGRRQQRRIVRDVVAGQQRDLVEHIVGQMRPGGGLQRRHEVTITCWPPPGNPPRWCAVYRAETRESRRWAAVLLRRARPPRPAGSGRAARPPRPARPRAAPRRPPPRRPGMIRGSGRRTGRGRAGSWPPRRAPPRRGADPPPPRPGSARRRTRTRAGPRASRGRPASRPPSGRSPHWPTAGSTRRRRAPPPSRTGSPPGSWPASARRRSRARTSPGCGPSGSPYRIREPGQAGRGLGQHPGYVRPAVVGRGEQQWQHHHVTLPAAVAGQRAEHLQRGGRGVPQEGPAGLEPGQPARGGPGPGRREQFRDGRPGPRVPAAVRDRDQRRGQVWMPHSVLPVPVHRPLRGSAPGATFIVQVAQPMEGYPS